MKLNDIEKAVLRGVLASVKRLAAADWHAADGLPTKRRGNHRLAVEDARRGFVRPDLGTWLGRAPTPSDYVAAARGYGRLERLGLLEKRALYDRGSSYLKLTPEGTTEAKRLSSKGRATTTTTTTRTAKIDPVTLKRISAQALEQMMQQYGGAPQPAEPKPEATTEAG